MFDFAAHWKKSRVLAAVAYYNLLAAALFCVPVSGDGRHGLAMATGRTAAERDLLAHLVLARVSCVLIWLIAGNADSEPSERPRRDSTSLRLPMEVVAAIAIALTAHLGGFLSGVNGPG